ncbi:uncharacterized protein [Rutidosis leptorrhynchoides]|uniref:uncharacterized protein n=1 Tax=Rutidosis leptorrhynchoides TaxID=125765 RepID=UPI003A99E020
MEANRNEEQNETGNDVFNRDENELHAENQETEYADDYHRQYDREIEYEDDDELQLMDEDDRVDITETTGETSEKIRPKRGPTKMIKTWGKEDRIRIIVLFNNFGQPVSKTTSELTHFLGTMARSSVYYLIYRRWSKLSSDKKKHVAKRNSLLNVVKSKFDVPAITEGWILRSLGRKVKNWKSRLKKQYYDPTLSLQEQYNSRCSQVQEDHCQKLVRYWNRRRNKKKLMQVTGKKSYARVREELKEKNNGQEPSHFEMFEKCFSNNGNTNCLEAQDAIREMNELKKNIPPGTSDEPGPDDIFSKVKGNDKYGNADL